MQSQYHREFVKSQKNKQSLEQPELYNGYFKVQASASKIPSFINLQLLHEQALKDTDASWRQSATYLELAMGHKVSYQAQESSKNKNKTH